MFGVLGPSPVGCRACFVGDIFWKCTLNQAVRMSGFTKHFFQFARQARPGRPNVQEPGLAVSRDVFWEMLAELGGVHSDVESSVPS